MARTKSALVVIMLTVGSAAALASGGSGSVSCTTAGPQAPREIAAAANAKLPEARNTATFTLSTDTTAMNLCNIHWHTNAEHKGPNFAAEPASGAGFACTASAGSGEVAGNVSKNCSELKVGSTIEVHWVYTSCSIAAVPTRPSATDIKAEKIPGLAPCLCAGGQRLRVEAQVFTVAANSGDDIATYNPTVTTTTKDGKSVSFVQAAKLPPRTDAVRYRGSTTGGDKYDAATKCSPAEATWNVTPSCRTIDATKLHAWCGSNVYGETKGHSSRQLVVNPQLLGPLNPSN